ncbi:hypothetical protein CLAFUW4_14821 [Fulvia fulva]|nr:hypothetical protein CLAFUR0_14814 [Fulvia fulva]WPV22996.1 hypothetical protein CLAFUW4_14821 [Fulvia fulva]WPV37947.1 hypothetical protein CLAFUW7_14822 [Fulvia fulva]
MARKNTAPTSSPGPGTPLPNRLGCQSLTGNLRSDDEIIALRRALKDQTNVSRLETYARLWHQHVNPNGISSKIDGYLDDNASCDPRPTQVLQLQISDAITTAAETKLRTHARGLTKSPWKLDLLTTWALFGAADSKTKWPSSTTLAALRDYADVEPDLERAMRRLRESREVRLNVRERRRGVPRSKLKMWLPRDVYHAIECWVDEDPEARSMDKVPNRQQFRGQSARNQSRRARPSPRAQAGKATHGDNTGDETGEQGHDADDENGEQGHDTDDQNGEQGHDTDDQNGEQGRDTEDENSEQGRDTENENDEQGHLQDTAAKRASDEQPPVKDGTSRVAGYTEGIEHERQHQHQHQHQHISIRSKQRGASDRQDAPDTSEDLSIGGTASPSIEIGRGGSVNTCMDSDDDFGFGPSWSAPPSPSATSTPKGPSSQSRFTPSPNGENNISPDYDTTQTLSTLCHTAMADQSSLEDHAAKKRRVAAWGGTAKEVPSKDLQAWLHLWLMNRRVPGPAERNMVAALLGDVDLEASAWGTDNSFHVINLPGQLNDDEQDFRYRPVSRTLLALQPNANATLWLDGVHCKSEASAAVTQAIGAIRKAVCSATSSPELQACELPIAARASLSARIAATAALIVAKKPVPTHLPVPENWEQYLRIASRLATTDDRNSGFSLAHLDWDQVCPSPTRLPLSPSQPAPYGDFTALLDDLAVRHMRIRERECLARTLHAALKVVLKSPPFIHSSDQETTSSLEQSLSVWRGMLASRSGEQRKNLEKLIEEEEIHLKQMVEEEKIKAAERDHAVRITNARRDILVIWASNIVDYEGEAAQLADKMDTVRSDWASCAEEYLQFIKSYTPQRTSATGLTRPSE